MEQEKNILMKDTQQEIEHSFFIRTILKEQWDLLENKNKTTIRLKSMQKTFYPSLENRNVISLINKYQKIIYLQDEV